LPADRAMLDPDQGNPVDNVCIAAMPHNGQRGHVCIFIIWLLIGAIAAWLAGLIVKGHGRGLAGNIVVGIAGAAIAGWLLPLILLIVGFVQQKMA
jgi:uncharacterized membrane protein YeaQ/YmgE (transglycosylase-associated protein family)